MSVDPYLKGSSKKVPHKKYFYQYAFEGEELSYDVINELEAEFEQPKGRRQARKQTHSKRKRVGDFY